MPFVAYGLGLLFKMGEIKMLTMVILGCCPGGTLSNFMALLLRGDMNLSILMTSVSTIVGVVAIPGMIKLLSSFFMPPCTDLQIDVVAIVKPLAMTLVPCLIGMAIKKWCPEKVSMGVLVVGKIAMIGGLAGILITQVIIYGWSLVTRFPLDILISCSIIPAAGFLIGFGCSMLAKEPPRSQRTIMLETGLKNAQICLAIMIVTFPPEKVGVLMMMPMYFVVFQIVESAILAFIFTKLIQTAEDQDKMLEYALPVEKMDLQRRFSTKVARRTHTPVGIHTPVQSRRNSIDERLIIAAQRGNGSFNITCTNCGHVAGTLKTNQRTSEDTRTSPLTIT